MIFFADNSFFGSRTLEAWFGGVGTLIGVVGFGYGVNRDRSVSAGDRTVEYHELVSEVNSPEFRAVNVAVNQALSRFPDIITRYRNRIQPTRDNIDYLFQFWDRVGSLLKHGRLDEGEVMPGFAFGCYVTWEEFQPLLDGYRGIDKRVFSGFAYLHERSKRYLSGLGQLPKVEHAQVH
jgi:hypothetical protein